MSGLSPWSTPVGRIVAVGRMDGAPLISLEAGAAKARTCVFFNGVATADLVGARPGALLYGIGAATAEHLALVSGGLPFMEDGRCWERWGPAVGCPIRTNRLPLQP